MNNTIIYLLGHYGVGKLTVAKAICRLTGARLFDNHLANNVVFSLIEADGKSVLPHRVWELIRDIRESALKAIEELSPPHFSFVLTNSLIDDPWDVQAFDRVEQLANLRHAIFLPVILSCDEAEHARRLPTPERVANLKHTDVASGLARRQTVSLLPIDHPNLLSLDTTHLSPDEAAAQIIAHLDGLT